MNPHLLELIAQAPRIFQALERGGFSKIRCIADGHIIVSAQLVHGPLDVVNAVRGNASRFPQVKRLEVYGVRSSPEGAITQAIVAFTVST